MIRRIPFLRPTSRLACLLLCCAAAQENAPAPGSPGLGDKYYPALGNGGYDAQHYDVVLDVDMASGAIRAELTMVARATQALSSFHLDFAGLVETGVLVDGQSAAHTREAEELIVTPAAPIPDGAEFTVEIAYEGVPQGVQDPGVPFVKDGVGWMRLKNGGSIVMSEPSGAHGWVPCNDHPQDKATWSFDVTVDAPWVVAANGILKERVEHDGKITSRFAASDPMASYLATVCIGDFDVVESTGPNGLPIRNYFYKVENDEKRAKSRAAFERTAEMIEHFSTLFGPYPFECVGAVMVEQSIGGALETQTIPVYSRGADESTVAHELAHQWFGNSVSVSGWDHLWLNEGFASYAEWLWRAHADGPEALEERALATYTAAHRMGPPGDTGPVIFGGSVYVRGAWTLHALRLAVGDEAFFKILREWAKRHHDGVADTQAFVALSEEI